MIPAFAISLEARDPAKRIARAYRIAGGRDLFGTCIVELQYGRIAAHGRVRQLAFDTDSAARTEICQRLKRRHSAPRRIGVPYRVVSIEGDAWLSPTPSDAPEMKE